MDFGGLLSSAPSLIGAAFQYEGQRQANSSNETIAKDATAANMAAAKDQMAFQERMSSTAHQREVEDLKKAGLNPILSVNAGASTPAGAAGSAQTAHMENTMGGFAASARDLQQLKLNMSKQDKELKLMDSQIRKTDNEAAVLSKGIPEADFKNKMYNIVRPLIDSFSKKAQSKASKGDPNFGMKPGSPWKSLKENYNNNQKRRDYDRMD